MTADLNQQDSAASGNQNPELFGITKPRPHPAARLLNEAGPTVSLAEAAKVLGISVNTAYAAVKRGELGVRTLRYGRRWRIPTADLKRVVGLSDISGGAA